MSSQDTSLKKDKYKNYFSVDNDTGNGEAFKCIFCDGKFKTVSTVKSHITRKHKDQIKDGEIVAEDANDDLTELDEARMEALELEMRNQEEGVRDTEAIPEADDTRMVINTDTQQLGSLPEAVERIKVLVEEKGVKEELIKRLETELETSKDLLDIANGEKEQTKIENEKLCNENKALKLDNVKYRKWVKNQITINDKMKEDGADPELKKAVKKLEEEFKVKSKAFETSEKARKELLKKVEEEVSQRGNLEADKERLTKTVDALTKLADKNAPKESTKPKIKCRDVDKAGGCPRAGSCRFYHPEVLVTFYNSHKQEARRQESLVSSRNVSPSRGMDVKGLMEQLRGLEKSGQSAPRMDTVQEGVHLLLRIAQQQAGRR